MEINRPRVGTLINTAHGKLCPPCNDGLHSACDYGKCECLCHSSVARKAKNPCRLNNPTLPLSGVARERPGGHEGKR